MTIGKMNRDKTLPQAAFRHLVPHASDMLLIDEVRDWTQETIITASRSHRKPDNPLRLDGRLSSVHLIEYGAQSMAIHCGLLTGKAHPGFLAAVRSAHFHVDDLYDAGEELIIHAQAQMQLPNGAVYQFVIDDNDNNLLLEARATVIHL